MIRRRIENIGMFDAAISIVSTINALTASEAEPNGDRGGSAKQQGRGEKRVGDDCDLQQGRTKFQHPQPNHRRDELKPGRSHIWVRERGGSAGPLVNSIGGGRSEISAPSLAWRIPES